MARKWILGLVGACLVQAPFINTSFAASKIKYGEWEIHMTVQGLPMEVPSQTERVCLNEGHLVPGKQQTHGCKVNWQIQDTTVSWTISCSNGASGKGSVVYNGDTMQGGSDMSMPNHSHLHSKINGKWIAAKCDVR